MYTVSFTDYMPTPRYDGIKWDTINIEESDSQDGPWVLIDTIAISPLDEDASDPTPRSFTTENATVQQGWYRVSFIDQAGDVLFTDPVHNAPQTQVNYRPTISQVGRKIMSRTRDEFGNLTGNFSPATNPTAAQVSSVIDDITTEVADNIGDNVPDDLRDDASNVLAIRAAMQVELNFFSDQVNTGRSVYPQLDKQYQDALAALQRQLAEYAEGATSVGGTEAAGSPSYNFPADNNWMGRRW